MPFSWCCPFRRHRSPSLSPSPSSSHSPASEDFGFKLLYENAGSTGLDIVAVHGLNGHRERSWTAENGTNWLRDLLPIDMPGIRVASWGWNLLEKGSSFQTISEKLIHELWELRSSTNTTNHPIVFIAHSAGGPIVKSALLYSNSTPGTSNVDLHSIKTATRGAVFLGTAELDSRLAGLQSYLASAQAPGQQTNEAYQEAQWLVTTLETYPIIGEQIWTLFVHERTSATSARSDEFSRQNRSSHSFVKVSHDGLAKFDRICEGYLQIKEHLMFVDLKAEIDA